MVSKTGLNVMVAPFNTTKAFAGAMLKEYKPH
jgi:hypothetical protein